MSSRTTTDHAPNRAVEPSTANTVKVYSDRITEITKATNGNGLTILSGMVSGRLYDAPLFTHVQAVNREKSANA